MSALCKSKWGLRVSAVILVGGLVLVTSSVPTQADERDDDRHRGNPFDRILHKLDKILDAIKDNRGGQDGNFTLRWDQNLPAAQRFVILAAFNNEAVLDKNTGLVWERSPAAAATSWESARSCINKNVGGQKGWRLPAIAELASLIDPAVPSPGPTLPPAHPFLSVQSVFFWSASTLAGFPTVAWGVNFSNGGVGAGRVADGHLVWCVRGGMQENVY